MREYVRCAGTEPTLQVQMDEPVAKLVRLACGSWASALESEIKRLKAMGLSHAEAEAQLLMLSGDDEKPGLISALEVQDELWDGQEGLFDGEPHEADQVAEDVGL